MTLSLRKVLISCMRIFGAVLCGTLLIVFLSGVFPRMLSLYTIFGVIINVIIGLIILCLNEFRMRWLHKDSMQFKHLITLMIIGGLFIELCLSIILTDSNETISIDGVLMRVDGKLTLAGWMNSVECFLAVYSVLILICFFYLSFLRVLRE